MKKSLIFVGMLSIGYAYAQTQEELRGRIGLNTASPNATLEVKVTDANSNNDTNQGVLIPKLTKTRVAAIANTKLVKGTLVFVEGTTYAGSNTKVADINADGFYYYNGTKWVRVEGSVLPSGNANGQVLKWNGSAWIASTDDNTNIYTNDGTLPTNRTVDLNAKTLGLNNGVVSIGSGDTWAPLRIHSTYSNGAIIALSNNNWDERVQIANMAGNFTIWSNGLTRFGIDKTNGNVAIGGNTATAKLHVQGNARVETLPTGTTTDQVVTADANGNLRKLPISNIDTNTTYSAGNGLTLSGTQFSLPVTINGTGNIVTDVTQTANGITVTKGNTNITDTSIYNSNGTITTQRDVALSGQFLNFNNGNVQVNGNANWAPFRVSSTHGSGAIMLLHPNNTNNQVHVRATTNGDAVLTTNGGGYVWISKNSGNVGIGIENPTAKLDVAGDIRTNAVIYNSDARLKKDVKNISNATATVNNLRSVTYHWNADGKKKGGNDTLQYGFIAQEVEKVLPSLVTTDSEGYKSVNYVAVVPVLVKALQEKDDEVKKLQSEVKQMKNLQSEMEQMKKEVEQIKQLLKKIRS